MPGRAFSQRGLPVSGGRRPSSPRGFWPSRMAVNPCAVVYFSPLRSWSRRGGGLHYHGDAFELAHGGSSSHAPQARRRAAPGAPACRYPATRPRAAARPAWPAATGLQPATAAAGNALASAPANNSGRSSGNAGIGQPLATFGTDAAIGCSARSRLCGLMLGIGHQHQLGQIIRLQFAAR